jgi:hypothetical protein
VKTAIDDRSPCPAIVRPFGYWQSIRIFVQLKQLVRVTASCFSHLQVRE